MRLKLGLGLSKRQAFNRIPQANLIADFNSQMINKVGDNGQVLYPCFKGDGNGKQILLENQINIGTVHTISLFIKPDFLFSEITNNTVFYSQTGDSYPLRFYGGKFRYQTSTDGTSVKQFTGFDTQGEWCHILIERNGLSLEMRQDLTILEAIGDLTIDADQYIYSLFAHRTGALSLNAEVMNMQIYDRTISEAERIELYNGNVLNNPFLHFPLTGHAYGFDANGNVITGEASDNSCFEGLCEWNPEEAYNNAPAGSNNLVIPESRINKGKDIEGYDIVTYNGAGAIPPYCVVIFPELTNDIFDRTNSLYWNVNTISVYNQVTGHLERGFTAETLMRGTEFLKSLQPNWNIFLKKRASDGAIERILGYKLPEIDYAQRVKVLKAVKDTETDASDNEIYCEMDSSAILNDVGNPAEISENVEKVFSINRHYYMIKTAGAFPTLGNDANGNYLQFAVDTEMSFRKVEDDSAVSLTETVYINGDAKTLKYTDRIAYADIPSGKLYQIKSHN